MQSNSAMTKKSLGFVLSPLSPLLLTFQVLADDIDHRLRLQTVVVAVRELKVHYECALWTMCHGVLDLMDRVKISKQHPCVIGEQWLRHDVPASVTCKSWCKAVFENTYRPPPNPDLRAMCS